MAATALSRPVYTEFWIRPDVNEQYTLDDKLLYIYLITNTHFLQHAIYKLSKRMMMMELNMPEDRFNIAFNRLENDFKVIKYSTKTNEVAILDYLKYGIISSGSALTNLFDNLGKKIDDLDLLKDVYTESLNLLDNRKELQYAKDKMRELLEQQGLISPLKEGDIDYSKAGMKTTNGYYDEKGVYHLGEEDDGMPF